MSEKLHSGHVQNKILGDPSEKTMGQILRQMSTEKMVCTSSIYMPSLVEVGLCTVTQECKKSFLAFSVVTLGMA